MARYVSQRKRNFLKGLTKFFAVILIIGCLAIPTFLILDLTQVFPIMTGANKIYKIEFMVPNSDEESEEKWILYNSIETPRSMRIDYSSLENPVKNGSIYKSYRFDGWDITGDGYEDILPSYSYSNLTAKAVFREVRR